MTGITTHHIFIAGNIHIIKWRDNGNDNNGEAGDDDDYGDDDDDDDDDATVRC